MTTRKTSRATRERRIAELRLDHLADGSVYVEGSDGIMIGDVIRVVDRHANVAEIEVTDVSENGHGYIGHLIAHWDDANPDLEDAEIEPDDAEPDGERRERALHTEG